MQSLTWYLHRLRSMPPGEILWRLRAAARDLVDRPRFAFGWLPEGASRPLAAPPPFRLVVDAGPLADAERPPWVAALLARADRLAANRLDLFDLTDVALGDPIDWQLDRSSGKRGGLELIHAIDYRDFDTVGDCKLVWEPNRHHQLVVLARAHRVSGDVRYARAVAAQLESWLDANPFGRGMNWRSPLELGIRMINWVVALDLVRDSGAVPEALWARIERAVYLHCWEIQRKYSRWSSANNHLIGEAAGVFCACSYFDYLPNARRWRDEAADVLAAEILAQTYPDGGTREQALGYQLFVMQFFTVCLWIAERVGHAFPDEYRRRLEQMFRFVLELGAAGGSLPKFGDCDDGYVLDLGAPIDDVDAWIYVAAALLGRCDFAPRRVAVPEPLYWLCGTEQRAAVERRVRETAPAPLESRAFRESGLYLLQTGDSRRGDHISLLFDCGELGYGSIAAHGHADALAFTLRAFGRDVLVDSGTYDYFSFPEWRRYFRSTAAHNTLRIDGLDQSEMLGPFLWGKRAECRLEEWRVTPETVTVIGSHDGYRKRNVQVTHRRAIELRRGSGEITIVDTLEGDGKHFIEAFFHVSPDCDAEPAGEHAYVLRAGDGELLVHIDAKAGHALRRATDGDPFGWISPSYHVKRPAAVIVAYGRFSLPVTLTTTIRRRGRPAPASHEEPSTSPSARM